MLTLRTAHAHTSYTAQSAQEPGKHKTKTGTKEERGQQVTLPRVSTTNVYAFNRYVGVKQKSYFIRVHTENFIYILVRTVKYQPYLHIKHVLDYLTGRRRDAGRR